MNDSSQLGLAELYLQSVYIEKLKSSGKHSQIYEILPSVEDVMRVWKSVEGIKSSESTQEVFITISSSYTEVSKEDVDNSLTELITDLIFSPFRKISLKALSSLSKYCDYNFRTFMMLVSKNHYFSTQEILTFLDIFIKYMLCEKSVISSFKTPSFVLVRTLLNYEFNIGRKPIELEELSDEESDDDDIFMSSAIPNQPQSNNDKGEKKSFKGVITDIFNNDIDFDRSTTDDKLRCYFVLSGLALFSLEFARRILPFLLNEVYFALPRLREVCLSLVFDIIFIHPCIFTENRKTKKDIKDESESEEDEEDEGEDEEEEKIKYCKILINFVNGPSDKLQQIAVFGLCRLLLGGPVGPDQENDVRRGGLKEKVEVVIAALVKKYILGLGEGNNGKILGGMILKFFRHFHLEKTTNQEELANTIGVIVIDYFDEESEKLSNGADHQIQFLLQCVQKKHHSAIVENVKYNIDNFFDVEVEHRTILQWLHMT